VHAAEPERAPAPAYPYRNDAGRLPLGYPERTAPLAKRRKLLSYLVGTAGFEPATP